MVTVLMLPEPQHRRTYTHKQQQQRDSRKQAEMWVCLLPSL